MEACSSYKPMRYDGYLDRKIREKRVETFKDVLEQIDREDNPIKYRRSNGYIVGFKPSGVEILPSDDLQKHVDAVQGSCECCLRGGLIMSMARKFDHVPMSLLQSEDDPGRIGMSLNRTHDVLRELFTCEEIVSLEAAFESNASYYVATNAAIAEYPSAVITPDMTDGQVLAMRAAEDSARKLLSDEIQESALKASRLQDRRYKILGRWDAYAQSIVRAVASLAVVMNGEVDFLWDDLELAVAEVKLLKKEYAEAALAVAPTSV